MAHTLRSHLAEYHAKAATHHGLLAAHHATLAKHFGKLAKAELGDGESFKAISDEHIALMKRHEDHAALHATLADKCAKAQQDWLEKTIRPDAFSSVPAQNTPDAGFGIRAGHGLARRIPNERRDWIRQRSTPSTRCSGTWCKPAMRSRFRNRFDIALDSSARVQRERGRASLGRAPTLSRRNLKATQNESIR